MKKMNIFHASSLFLIFLLCQLFILKNTHAKYQLFKSEVPLNLEISGDYKEIIDQAMRVREKKRFNDNSCRPYNTVSLNHTFEGKDVNLIALARLRGWSRMSSKECKFYPIKIKFIKNYDFPNPLVGDSLLECQNTYRNKNLGPYNIPSPIPHAAQISKKNSIFHKSKTLKLVTQCNPTNKARWVHRELAIYKLYEIVTKYSLKTRAVYLSYRNRSSDDIYNLDGKILTKHFGFFIENEKKLAQRTQMESIRPYDEFGPYLGYDPKKINYDLYLKAQIFNYLVGNLDSEISLGSSFFGRKIKGEILNINFIKHPQTKLYYPIPYDFDWAVTTVRHNVPVPLEFFPYFCQSLDRVKQTISYFSSIQNQLISKIDTFNFLNHHEKQRFKQMINLSLDYLQDHKKLKKIYKKTMKEYDHCSKKNMIK